MYFVYVLLSDKKTWYIGFTADLRRRYQEHRQRGKWELKYYEAYDKEQLARMREKKLKHYGSAWRGLQKRLVLRGRGQPRIGDMGEVVTRHA